MLFYPLKKGNWGGRKKKEIPSSPKENNTVSKNNLSRKLISKVWQVLCIA